MSSYTSRRFLQVMRVVMVMLSVTIYSLTAVTSVVLADDAPPPSPIEETPIIPPPDSNDAQVKEADVEVVVSDAVSTPAIEEMPAQPEAPQNEQALAADDTQVAQDTEPQMMVSDPVWCPEGSLPGEAGCTSNAASLSLLIFGLGTKTGPGTIYFTSTYNNADTQLNYHDVELSGLDAITLQGGWNGSNAGSGFSLLSGGTTFITPITILWSNDVTVKNINGVGIQISTDNPSSVMDITLSDVNMTGSVGAGALLDNGSAGSTGDIVLTGTNTFNNNGSDGLSVTTNGDIDITGSLTASDNGGNGASLDNSGGTGAVDISGTSAFNGNALDGLNINSSGTVKAENIIAGRDAGNGGDGADIKTTGVQVTVSGDNTFNNNTNNGLKIESNGAINIANITASNNVTGDGIQLTAVSDVLMEGTNTTAGNALHGVAIYTSGDITLYSDMVSTSNGADGFYLQAASAIVRCGYSVSNTGYQLNDHVSGALIWYGNPLAPASVSDNGSGTVRLGDCVFPELTANGVTLGLNVIYVNSGAPEILDCNGYYGILLVLPNGDSAYIACPVYGEVTLTSIAQVGEDPPDGEFTSGFILDFSNKDIPVTGLVAPVSTKNRAQISFVIPAGKSGDDYDILYWDDGKWNKVENPVFENGKLSAHVDFMGTFILVDK